METAAAKMTTDLIGFTDEDEREETFNATASRLLEFDQWRYCSTPLKEGDAMTGAWFGLEEDEREWIGKNFGRASPTMGLMKKKEGRDPIYRRMEDEGGG